MNPTYEMLPQMQQPSLYPQAPALNQMMSPPVPNCMVPYAGGGDPIVQREICLMNERANVEIKKHIKRSEVDEEHFIYMLKKKEDIQIKRGMLSEKVVLTAAGGIIRQQEFFLEQPKEYQFANFTILERPIKYVNDNSEVAAISLKVVIENRRKKILFLDLGREEAGYFLRKFRMAGITFQRRRDEGRGFIFDILQVLSESAEIVRLPEKRGFFRTQDGKLNYAGTGDLIWKDVIECAK